MKYRKSMTNPKRKNDEWNSAYTLTLTHTAHNSSLCVWKLSERNTSIEFPFHCDNRPCKLLFSPSLSTIAPIAAASFLSIHICVWYGAIDISGVYVFVCCIRKHKNLYSAAAATAVDAVVAVRAAGFFYMKQHETAFCAMIIITIINETLRDEASHSFPLHPFVMRINENGTSMHSQTHIRRDRHKER